MKKVFFLALMIISANAAFSQYSLTFCNEVSTEGKPDGPSTSMVSTTNGNKVKLLVKSDDKFKTNEVEYRIFYVDKSGNETEINKLPQMVENDWDFAWKQVVFYDPGTYRVKVYDEKGQYLTSSNLSIKQN